MTSGPSPMYGDVVSPRRSSRLATMKRAAPGHAAPSRKRRAIGAAVSSSGLVGMPVASKAALRNRKSLIVRLPLMNVPEQSPLSSSPLSSLPPSPGGQGANGETEPADSAQQDSAAGFGAGPGDGPDDNSANGPNDGGSGEDKQRRRTPEKEKEKDPDPNEDPREKSPGVPPLTATSRAALAETVPYYRSYQGGGYSKDDRIMAFFLGASDSHHAHFDADVVITRSGGHYGVVGGVLQQVSNVQEDNKQVRDFRRTMREKIPIVLFVGADNDLCPTRIPENFCAMGWFHITDVWAEINNRKTGFRYRMERIRRDDNMPWWAADQSVSYNSTVNAPACHLVACSDCGESCKQIFEIDWTCLNMRCNKFFKIAGRRIDGTDFPKYSEAFLNHRNEYPEYLVYPFSIRPEEQKVPGDDATFGGGYDRRMWKGFCCPKCWHCSPRRDWHEFSCDRCGYVNKVHQPPISMAMIRGPHTIPFTGHAFCTNYYNTELIEYFSFIVGWFVFRVYDLGHGNFVFHVQSNEHINAAPGGPDDMLHDLQTDPNLKLRRRPLGNKSGKFEGLVNFFNVNYGMPYKFIVAQHSYSFDEAPPCLIESLQRCQWIANQAIGEENLARQPLNEVLAVGYLAEGSMGYHDDGEKELGQTVVAQCIGGDAKMRVRLKDQYWKGMNKTKTPVSHKDRVPMGALFEEERREIQAEFGVENDLTAEEKVRYKKRIQDLHKKGGRTTSEAKHILELNFKHGDFFVMHGPDVQKYYEHGLTMESKLRFALTCRHVLTEPYKNDEEVLALGKIDTSKFTYDGATDGSPPRSDRIPLDTVPRSRPLPE